MVLLKLVTCVFGYVFNEAAFMSEPQSKLQDLISAGFQSN